MLAFFFAWAPVTAARGGDLVELSEVREYSFEHGYEVIELNDAGARVVKTVPGPADANISAYLDSEGERFFLSDWSHERLREGKSFFWMRPKAAPSPQRAVPVPATVPEAPPPPPPLSAAEAMRESPAAPARDPEPEMSREETTVSPSLRGYGALLATGADPALAAEIVTGLKGLREETPKLREIREGRAAPDPGAILRELEKLRESGVPVATSAQVAATLGDSEALVDFFRTGGSREGDAAGFYGAVVLVRGQPPRLVRIGDGASVDRFVGELRSFFLGKEPGQAVDRAERDATAAGLLRKGYDLVMGPLEKEIRIHRQLTICGDGQLSILPFDLLEKAGAEWGGEGPVRMAGDLWEIRYANAAGDLARIRSAGRAEEERRAVLVGNPDFDLETSADLNWEDRGEPSRSGEAVYRRMAGAAGEIRLPPLPGAEQEIERLSAWLKGRGVGVLALTGAEATARNVIEKVRSPDIFHLETYGLFWGESPTGDRGQEEALPMSSKHRAGLALAGAQTKLERWRAGELPAPLGDGILLAEELAKLDLGGTGLAVLSLWAPSPGDACGGAGILELRAALIEAGARNVVLPLWPVQPGGTADLMDRFYKELLKDQTVPAALKDARGQVFRDIERREGLFEAVRRVGAFIAVAAEPWERPSGNESASGD